MSPLNGKTFVLELSRDIRFKAKQELINYLREQNANISYILTASTDYVLVSNDIDTYKTRRAKQLGIPLVNVEYIYEYRIGKESIDIKRYIVTSAEDKENFSKNGTISVSGGGNSSTNTNKPVMKIDVSKIKIWNSDDVELPKFDEITHAEIGKWAIFKETNENSDIYFVLELQIIPEEYFNKTINDYRLRFRYEKQIITNLKGKSSLIQYAFSHDINELQQLFASFYNRIITMPRITRIRDLLPDKLGSKLLLRSLFFHRIDTQMLDDNVCQLIESLWIESIGDLNKILSVKPETIALQTIIEAEAALLEIKSDSKSASEAEAQFYSLIPHQPTFIIGLITNRRALIDKIDLCQMLRDLLTVNELTNWNIKASIEAKYRALKCHIETLGSDTQEYARINDMINSSTNTNEKVIVHQIYSVAKQTDVLNFRSTLFNQKQLFHGSKYNNFLGILSRGLVMPKMVVNDLGITRTDIGCLGYGIYFSDSISTSLKYTTSSITRPGRRLLCISQVALGDSAKYYSYASNLTQPPENFHSTHGVKRTNENNSKFVDDEYAIYNLDQQRLLYIVELSWIPFDDNNNNQLLKSLPIIRDSFSKFSTNEINIPPIIEDEIIQVAEQDYGLICPSSGQLVPLKAFHIRAQLVDITAEVVLYQVYHNTSLIPIEAKYVFPLDENCSVCGFEAHINNKIIKGVVKEKEQAKREYREAIEKGHGAYLMHQEQPEVFSVSVGNLPANCEVIIKITYVTELPIENNDIIFRLPAKVASWQSKQILNTNDQTILPSINLEQNNSSMKSVEFSLKTSMRMPYEITKLFSPTHRLRRKITDCIAMIELVDNILLEKDFILSITLKTVNLPRMLNETYDDLFDENSQACMLTFYPKFEMMNNLNEYVEIVFIIDVSNSMDGKHVQQAKQLAHLFLTNMKQNDGNIYFNIVTFGSDNDECFPISSPNTKENIDKAKHFILHSLDHRGNTDLFSVLRQYSLIPSSSKLGRQFILLSDGHINELESILNLLTNQSSMRHDRLFTCSIGDTSNKHNLKQLANQANGGGLNTLFDTNYRSRWKTKVIQILEYIHQPCIRNISIDWHGTINNQQDKFTNQAPKFIRSVFNGMRLTVYRFIQNCHKATLTAMIDNQEFITSVFSNKITETKGRILHCLTARAIIHDYENGLLDNDQCENELIKKQYKQDLIELSIKYSVVSSFTSFVAIEERDGEALQPGVRLLDVMLENDIDLLPYIGWDGDRSQMDLIKEKLVNAKRLFDSASISNKIELTNEYEQFCKNISYRSGGDAKYELMLTIIDTYRTILKETDKARQLEEKMMNDLNDEIKNATADERNILEKRLDELNRRLQTQESEGSDDRSISFEEEEEEHDDDHDDEGLQDFLCWDDESGGDVLQLVEMNSEGGGGSGDDIETSQRVLKAEKSSDILEELSYPTSFASISKRVEFKSEDMEESDEDLGFDLFDVCKSMPLQSAALKLKACDAPLKTEAKKWLTDSEDDGDDGGNPLLAEIRSFSKAKLPEKALDRVRDAPLAVSKEEKESEESLMEVLRKRLNTRRALLKREEDSLSSLDSWAEVPITTNTASTSLFESQSLRIPPQSQHGQGMFSPSYTPSSPSYQPTSPSYSPVKKNERSSLIANDFKFEMQTKHDDFFGNDPQLQQPSVLIPTNGDSLFPNSDASSSFSLFSASEPASFGQSTGAFTSAPSSLFTGFGGVASSTTSASGASSLFGGFGAPPSASSTFSFGAPPPASSTFSFGAPPPPPPPPMFPATAFLPPPAPPNLLFNAPPPPPPLPASSNFSFGVRPPPPPPPMSLPTAFPPPPPPLTMFPSAAPPPPPPTFSFGSPLPHPPPTMGASTVPVRLPTFLPVAGAPLPMRPVAACLPSGAAAPFSFGTVSTTNTTTNSVTSTTSSELKCKKLAAPSQSVKYSFIASADRSNSDKSRAIIKESDTDSIQQHLLEKESSRANYFLAREASEKPQEILKVQQDTTVRIKTAAARHARSYHSTRFSDTRSDEHVEQHLVNELDDLSIDGDAPLLFTPGNKMKKSKKLQLQSDRSNKTMLQDLLLLDVTPLDLGIEDVNGHMCTIVDRNRTIPIRTQPYLVFTNAYAYQTTATIRVFQGQHKLTKYNTFIGEFTLTGLTSNFVSQILEISISMEIDANGLIHVEAEETRSGSKAKITIDPKNYPINSDDLQRHLDYVESNPAYRAVRVADRQANDPLYMLKGETENAKINFTNPIDIAEDFPTFDKLKTLELNSTVINELKRIQSTDGSFDLNQDLANLLSININKFDALKKYLYKQGFNSFALNIQNEIIHLIATGLILMELFFQIPTSERKTFLVPFDHEKIRSIFHHYLPNNLLENLDRAIDFYEQKRSRYGIYCEQLELKYSTWEKFIQYSIFHIDN